VQQVSLQPRLSRGAPSSNSGRRPPCRGQALLQSAIEGLAREGQDKTAHPILTVTYLRKPIKQIAAAEELGLSYSTYRRRHAEAVTRLTEILWQRAVSPSN
jgi:hypothetical protein